jgi:hypothetical protein
MKEESFFGKINGELDWIGLACFQNQQLLLRISF